MTEKRERWQNYGDGIIGEVAPSSHLSYQLQLFETISPTTGHTWNFRIGTDDPVTGFANKYDAWRAASVVLAALIGA